jgi:hypothetical protein
VPAIVYLHGFNSSPGSIKARQLLRALSALHNPPGIHVPALPHSPADAMAKLDALCVVLPGDATLVGSSLGGYYATCLAQKHGCRAVLINPAVRPYEDLSACLGPNRNLYTGESYDLTPAHVEELRAMDVQRITRPERYWLLVQTGDEVLDYRQAVARYVGAKQSVIAGGDHGFQGFESYIPDILRFAGCTLS